MTPIPETTQRQAKRVGRPPTLPNVVRKTITLDESDVAYVEEALGRNFSESIRRLIEGHRRARREQAAAG